MKKVSLVSGVCLIAISGVLFTFERFLSIFYYAILSFDPALSSIPSEPSMPNVFDNILVFALLLIGIGLIWISFSKLFKVD
ncbi:hypothetical protein [Ornithinibacillus contaminans]|uniref:hypothetical protein n=1 Tax=Ornithinibacillus contaminans TaxID=694055 RepID=UPI00064DE99E|nr:hypothetical protein [Ornithinibacillus contaminans]